MKKTILSILTLAAALTASADDTTTAVSDLKAGFSSVEIRTVSGETTTVTLTDEMTTQFTTSDVVFADATTTVSIPLDQLRTYTFVEAAIPEGITTIGLSSNTAAQVFDLEGRLVATTRGLNLAQLKPGTYIVRIAGTSIKINHK